MMLPENTAPCDPLWIAHPYRGILAIWNGDVNFLGLPTPFQMEHACPFKSSTII